MIAGSAQPIHPNNTTAQSGLVGVIEVMITDTDGNVIQASSASNILELDDNLGVPTGVYVAARTAPGPVGPYVIVWSTDGTFDAETVSSEDLTVVAGSVTPVLPPIPVGPGLGPQKGPCTMWADPTDVMTMCGSVSSDTTLFDEAVAAASELLYELSGEQFAGQCEETVRPCRVGCGCSFSWNGVGPGPGWYWSAWGLLGWGWGYDGASDLCGCGPVSQVLIPGYPVSSIVEVVIVDQAVDPIKYELRDNAWLVRLVDSTDPTDSAFWPACQDLSQPLGEPGTWSVTATFGQDPPMLGTLACKQLACELVAFMTTGECDLPATATQITRQGLTIERVPFIAWGIGTDGTWGTGLQLVDAFLSAYNPIGMVRRPSVWSPDIPQFARDAPLLGT